MRKKELQEEARKENLIKVLWFSLKEKQNNEERRKMAEKSPKYPKAHPSSSSLSLLLWFLSASRLTDFSPQNHRHLHPTDRFFRSVFHPNVHVSDRSFSFIRETILSLSLNYRKRPFGDHFWIFPVFIIAPKPFLFVICLLLRRNRQTHDALNV